MRVRGADAGDLVERRRRAVVLDLDPLDQRGRGPAGADARRSRAPSPRRERCIFGSAATISAWVTTAPRRRCGFRSPRRARARRMLPGCVMSKTTIGISLSIARLTAVASSASSRFARSSVYPICVKRVAPGCFSGSASYTPSTRVAFRITSAAELDGAQGRRGIGREVGVAGAGHEDDDPALLEVPHRSSPNIRLGDLVHGDGAHHPGRRSLPAPARPAARGRSSPWRASPCSRPWHGPCRRPRPPHRGRCCRRRPPRPPRSRRGAPRPPGRRCRAPPRGRCRTGGRPSAPRRRASGAPDAGVAAPAGAGSAT